MIWLGFITHVMRETILRGSSGPVLMEPASALSSFRSKGSLRSKDDGIHRIMTVCILPLSPDPAAPPRLHRRLDLLFPPANVYWTTIVGWCVRPSFMSVHRSGADVQFSAMFPSAT